jgi:O-antigen/teichoic acid export membrane protein
MAITLSTLARFVLPTSFYEKLTASNIGKRFVRGTFWSLVNSIVAKAATFVQAILLARILGINGFGEWGILLSTIAMVQVFASLSLEVAAIKYVAQWRYSHPERLGRLLGLLQIVAICTGVSTCLVMVLCAPVIADHLLKAPQLAGPVAMVGIIVLLSAISDIFHGVLTGLERFRELAWISSVSTLTGVILTVFLAFNQGLLGALFGVLVTNFVTLVIFFRRSIVLFREVGIKVEYSNCSDEWRCVWNYAIPSMLAGIVVTVSFWMAQVVLVQQSHGYEAMGAYHAANQWRTIIIFLPTQILSAFLPVMSSLFISDPERLRVLQDRILINIMLLTLVLTLPVALLSPWLMQLYGQDFTAFSLTLVAMAILPIFDIGHVVLQQSAIVYGYMWMQLVANVILIVVVAVGTYWLIPKFMALGLAVTLLLGYVARFFAELVLFRHRSKAALQK